MCSGWFYVLTRLTWQKRIAMYCPQTGMPYPKACCKGSYHVQTIIVRVTHPITKSSAVNWVYLAMMVINVVWGTDCCLAHAYNHPTWHKGSRMTYFSLTKCSFQSEAILAIKSKSIAFNRSWGTSSFGEWFRQKSPQTFDLTEWISGTSFASTTAFQAVAK